MVDLFQFNVEEIQSLRLKCYSGFVILDLLTQTARVQKTHL